MDGYQTNTYRRLDQGQRKLFACTLPTTARTVYTCPQGKRTRIDSIVFVNLTTGSVGVTLHHVLPNDTHTDCNKLYNELSLSSKTTIIDDTVKYMVSGETLVALATSASHIAMTVYGEET